jgi:hypothetical protein
MQMFTRIYLALKLPLNYENFFRGLYIPFILDFMINGFSYINYSLDFLSIWIQNRCI